MPLKGNYTPSEIERVQTIVAYIESHYNEKLTIESLSYEAGLSPKLLQQIFSSLKGVPIHQYQLEFRLKKVIEDLQNFEWTLEYIAKKHGFCSAKYFYRFFKKQMGVTAQQFRVHQLQHSVVQLYPEMGRTSRCPDHVLS